MRKLLFLIIFVILHSKPIDFSLYKLDSVTPTNRPALLILSGIQGDEPGAFNATSILIKHYKILNGNVWVVPNLNQYSILKNNRGIYGDMNRKFAELSINDPEYKIIQDIKKIILDDDVVRVLHLHDGSGFYRDRYINNLLNQSRWGNCSIIDQNTLFEYDDLNININEIVNHINNNLLDNLHRYHVRNTNTAQGDIEQSKSLTYFATINKKMAFANEASKSLPLEQRVYYHLLAIEGMFKIMNIEFKKDFELNTSNIKNLINDKNMNIVINDIIELPLYNIKNSLNYFPIQKDNLRFYSNTPIIWLFEDGNNFRIKNGNKNIVYLKPFFIDFDDSLKNVSLVVDDNEVEIPIGTIIKVKDSFSVNMLPYRVNIIGYSSNKLGNSDTEAGITIKRDDLIDKFSIDKTSSKFRVEFYKKEGNIEKFSGMIIIDFQS
ncbi:M99 family carboxypeptidase catalytic domain-containing protein [Helicobacter sp. MIT 14-3879]|uniref:M99 family carboxypeptidase catalytic domain-containing protein n=1 Tax=Helicobacter sp. MIT 14-3879 TaxID=2040649 RepID=UPI000E1E6410|nr:M99 family carboxypeptidase catalytic domain-containing protein [Helicobacter sp. MIT 14-3879]RDU65118.1 purine-nucleoside phosphorylase [Helicobacter sp. MIT 14-3879]